MSRPLQGSITRLTLFVQLLQHWFASIRKRSKTRNRNKTAFGYHLFARYRGLDLQWLGRTQRDYFVERRPDVILAVMNSFYFVDNAVGRRRNNAVMRFGERSLNEKEKETRCNAIWYKYSDRIEVVSVPRGKNTAFTGSLYISQVPSFVSIFLSLDYFFIFSCRKVMQRTTILIQPGSPLLIRFRLAFRMCSMQLYLLTCATYCTMRSWHTKV